MDRLEDVVFDFVVTLCDNADLSGLAGNRFCTWSSPDPALITGSKEEKFKAFWLVAQQINRRLELLAALPFGKLDALRLEAATREIGTREIIGSEAKRGVNMKPTVLILCTGNSCRSHMAEGILRESAGDLLEACRAPGPSRRVTFIRRRSK